MPEPASVSGAPKARILIADELSADGVRMLRSEAGLEVDVRLGLSPEALKAALPGTHGLIVRSSTRVTAELIEAADALAVIGRAGIGVDNIDVEAATRRGVLVMNTPQGNVASATEHTFALMLSLARNVVSADAELRSGKWNRKELLGSELRGKVLGIVGLGKIGAEVAAIARSLGMRVIASDPYLSTDRAQDVGVPLVPFGDLLEQSDFITIHTPLTDRTHHMFGRREFQRMKKGARLINCARGGIVDEQALVEALDGRQIAGAALDVFEQEPPRNAALLGRRDVTLTPHLGASTEEAQQRVAEDIAQQFIEYFRDGKISNAVNLVGVEPAELPYLELGRCLGSLLTQLSAPHLKRIEIAFQGEITQKETRAIATSVLTGCLMPICSENVNMVNAPVLARERGIQVFESRSAAGKDYLNLLTVRAESEQGSKMVAGTLFADKEPRIVRIDSYELDLIPARNMLLMFYPDRPGVVGKIGTILGSHEINIARMEVGRTAPRQQAVMILTLDETVPPAVLAEIQRAIQVEQIWPIEL